MGDPPRQAHLLVDSQQDLDLQCVRATSATSARAQTQCESAGLGSSSVDWQLDIAGFLSRAKHFCICLVLGLLRTYVPVLLACMHANMHVLLAVICCCADKMSLQQSLSAMTSCTENLAAGQVQPQLRFPWCPPGHLGSQGLLRSLPKFLCPQPRQHQP